MLFKRRIIRRGYWMAMIAVASLPLLTGCNPGLAWGFGLDWYALLVFAPLRSAYGSAMLGAINQF